MESFIIFAVIALLSSLFSSSKKKEQKSMPPFGKTNTQKFDPPNEKVERRNTSLEDFAKEIFQQLNEKDILPKEMIEPQVEKVEVEKKVERQPTQVENQENVQNSRQKLDENRSNRTNEKTKLSPRKNGNQIKDREIGSFIPNSREALVQAIITSEILGPPKAKR